MRVIQGKAGSDKGLYRCVCSELLLVCVALEAWFSNTSELERFCPRGFIKGIGSRGQFTVPIVRISNALGEGHVGLECHLLVTVETHAD